MIIVTKAHFRSQLAQFDCITVIKVMVIVSHYVCMCVHGSP